MDPRVSQRSSAAAGLPAHQADPPLPRAPSGPRSYNVSSCAWRDLSLHATLRFANTTNSSFSPERMCAGAVQVRARVEASCGQLMAAQACSVSSRSMG
jgi:hypothetical protein